MINWLLNPTTNAPSRLAKKASDAISPANQEGSRLRGFLSGATEGVGKLADDMTSPLSIAATLLGAGGAKALGSAGKSIYRAAAPTMDLIEDAPAIKQVMPTMGDVESLIGDLSKNLTKIPNANSRVISGGINPAILPPGMIGSGAESTYNGARSIPNAARSLEDIAYDSVRSSNGKRGLKLADMMSNLKQARGR